MDILRRIIFVVLTAAGILVQTASLAQISPGELSDSHADLEGMRNCLKCHDLGEGPSDGKCMECHDEIAWSLGRDSGYHRGVAGDGKKECYECHSEHAGRDFRLIYWEGGVNSFDHSSAGYDLAGKHAGLKCRDCHKSDLIREDLSRFGDHVKADRTYLGLGSACLDCHADPHRGQLKSDCARCHNNDGWKPVPGFDHARTTFALTGRHIKLACIKCHPTIDSKDPAYPESATFIRYTGLAHNNCAPCHTDVHKGTYGEQCARCHNTANWQDIPTAMFDHSKTRFPLAGRHASLKCDGCHVPGARKSPLPHELCTDCHADTHRGQLKVDCAGCHDNDGWKPAPGFDHALTVFALNGRHIEVACVKCHPAIESKDPEYPESASFIRYTGLAYNNCTPCHADTHRGQFAARDDGGACESCHTVDGFLPALYTIEDHGRTRFALAGAHLAQPCVACHPIATSGDGASFRMFNVNGESCESCHNDPHAGQFSGSSPKKDCADCHSIVAWLPVPFDHDRDTAYRLEGEHKRVPCKGCHVPVTEGGATFIRYRPIDPSCKNCHEIENLELGKIRPTPEMGVM